ncbi:MAG TPA: glycoside hydrolase family 3 N-terminal domain-containing protein [Thermoanaerobaculia bacterium]|jgi:beta-N-acetylhexosaminidase|nr:glycoside hydrolase family 3 N-terminal domain-containing protein [Thermoanaerobaculia bacterium]
MLKRTVLVLLLLLTLPARADKRERWIEQSLRSMSLDEKVGQVLIVSGIGGFKNQQSEAFEKIRQNIVEYHVGGYNVALGDPAAAAVMINSMQRLSRLPLLISGDLEGGAGYVFPGSTRLPRGMAIAATNDEAFAYEAGKIAAKEGRALGFHVNYYPVADVNSNPQNPIINIRSFGEDPAKVSAMVQAYVRGCQDNGMLCTAKHFPGHGDTATDSHSEMPVVTADRKRLDAIELVPFRAAIDANVAAIMTAHIALPEIEPDTRLPATLSPKVLTKLLREDLRFPGLIFTDALDMQGVLGTFGEGEVAVRALEAGADVLLFAKPDTMHPAIKAAVESGRLSTARLEQSVRRILDAKWRSGLAKERLVDLSRIDTVVGSREHREKAQEMMDRAITLVRNQNNAVPLSPSTDLRVLQLNVLDNTTRWINNQTPGPVFAAELKKRFPKATAIQIDERSSPQELELVRKAAEHADAIVVGTFVLTRWAKGTIELPQHQIALLRDLVRMKKPFVLAAFGSPYVIRSLPETPSYLAAYETHDAAQIAAAKAIAGEIEIRGVLPVNVNP